MGFLISPNHLSVMKNISGGVPENTIYKYIYSKSNYCMLIEDSIVERCFLIQYHQKYEYKESSYFRFQYRTLKEF